MHYHNRQSISISPEFIVCLILFFSFPANGKGFTMVKPDEDHDKEEREKAEKDRLVDDDDPEELARQRAMDDFKDDNKRGWGNRYNRS